MTHPIQICIIVPLLTTVFSRRDDNFISSMPGIVYQFIRVISPISQKILSRYAVNQSKSLATISCGTSSDKDSDWHTMRIHGQMYFAVEPPFVLPIP